MKQRMGKSWSRLAGCWVLLAALWLGGGAAAAETVSLIDPEQPEAGWGFNNGAEFPGAKGGFAADLTVEAQRRPALRLDVDLTGGGNYVDIHKNIPAAEVENLTFWLKAPAAQESITLRIVDGTGQCHQINFKVEKGGHWQQIKFPLRQYFENAGTSASVAGVLRYEGWGGANDGKWHNPGKSIAILAGALGEVKKNTLWLSGIKLQMVQSGKKVKVAQEIRLDDFLRAGEQAWSFNNGAEFPGAKGGVSVVKDEPAAGEFAMRIAGDFTGGGAYVDAGCGLGGKDVSAVKFRVKTANVKHFSVRLIDATDQCHQAKNFQLTPDNAWHEVTVEVDKAAGGEHWGGANDGKWHGGGKGFHILLGKDSAADLKPEILLTDIRADAAADVEIAGEPYREDFEKGNPLPQGWSGKGPAPSLTADAPFAGKQALRLNLPEKQQNEPLVITGASFPAGKGQWNIGGALRSDLHSPDNSFCVRVAVEALHKGAPLERIVVAEQTGKKNWRSFGKLVEFPANTEEARFVISYEKTFGTCDIDALAALPVAGRKAEKLVERIMINSAAVGNLFLPEDAVTLNLNIQTLKPLPPEALTAQAVITDYWGAEQLPASVLKLTRDGVEKQLFRYRASITLPAERIPVGKYFELHVAMTPKGFAPAKEYSAFARLPEAESRKYPPLEIPFTIRSWDNRIPAYMELASRIGHRNLGVWGGWDKNDPAKVEVPTIDLCRKLGNNWVTGTPCSDVERNGFANYSEENLRAGMTNFLKKFAKEGLSYICLGNEPPERPDKIAEKVKAYKVVYEAAKAFDPNIKIIATSVPPLKTFFDAGYHKYCDIYDFHVYETYDNVRQAIRTYKKLMKEYKAEKPIFCTELGLNSQGQTRHAVAQEVVKKITAFFAEGGENVSWFGIEYPDSEGRARGTSGNAHNTFDCQYCCYNPRLDAIMYYNMINGITIKKFVDEVQHAEGVQNFLFRDKNGECLQVLWREKGRLDCGVNLAGAGKVRLIRIDGSSAELTPENGVITLAVSPEPVMLRYTKKDGMLAKNFAPAAFSVKGKSEKILKGQSAEFILSGEKLTAAAMTAEVPPFWKAEFKDKGGEVVCTVTAPEKTDARAGRVMLRKTVSGQPCGEVALTLTMVSPLDIQVLAAGRDAAGEPVLNAVIVNNGSEAKNVSWTVELTQAFAMNGGTYAQDRPETPSAYLKGESEGQTALKGGERREIQLRIIDSEPQTIYRLRANLSDDAGGRITFERYVGGFAAALRAADKIVIDGKLAENVWKKAPQMLIDTVKQRFVFGNTKAEERWKGKGDLSAVWRAAWDERNLYLAVQVADDVYRVQFADGNIWNQDGLQFLFDPMRTAAEKPGKYDYSIGAGTKGPQAWCHLSADVSANTGEVKDIQCAVADWLEGGKGGKIYEIAIPWTRLAPFKPAAGANLGMSLILNEDDGDGRDGFMGWFDGVHSKELDHAGDLLLAE